MNTTKITLPSEDDKCCFFQKHKYQLEVPFIVYADIEAILSDVTNEIDSPKGAYQEHIAHSIGYYFHCKSNVMESYYRSNSGPNCIDWFCDELKSIARLAWKQLLDIKPMLPLTQQQLFDHEAAKNCHICDGPFFEDEAKIFDHSHLTGFYRGPSHNACNLNYKESNTIPVVFHNLQYDLHFLIEKIAASCSGSIDIIPINNEKYISFTKKYSKKDLVENSMDDDDDDDDDGDSDNIAIKLRFIDSYRFMSDSLANLATLTSSKTHRYQALIAFIIN